ncbi:MULTISPECIES: methionine gamma-lyase family protein [Mitsuokella]|uniref:methionine gamma-lyase family protein n=1 Tax=Mitsuokella TaxID=52225 RepID=UPI000568E079|nr:MULTISPECIES: methionine gamma-lyase family protein [Mitsuokella]MCI6611061.1 methionine gamma-lyase family protein [Mitsuokella jalaludinii]MCI7185250.1 methionine gamma-lyase family protein [Mitsuokella jalaludinii]MCQ1532980.1 methionine gamma-lyase family protein [Mitsuokella jalaludinii]MDD7745027.1 methionine gamma-lyase family protein [Mitsuokella jalaludinii]MDY5365179.1 methionine gamma-lyase family protein [Mitsuokella jalaludinii]
MSFSKKITDLKREVLKESEPLFAHIEDVAEANTLKVLDAMRECRVSDAHFNTTTGYAYDDIGRGKLEELYAKIFGAERALVRTQFVSGTHALATVLFGILRPGDELVSLTGKPYDTMQTVIGYDNPSPGSLKEFGVLYNELPMVAGKVDMAHIKDVITDKTKMVEIQRSRGYSMRSPLSIEDIRAITTEVHRIKPDCICFVDNCYGEFVDYEEPTQAGADIMAGSLIKNPGGGIAPTGGYIVGRDDLVELASYRLTAPGMGDELGASLSNNRLLFQGLFLAPHVVSQAIKGAIFAAGMFAKLGYKTLPLPTDVRGDIIQAIELGSADKLIAFCGGIQKYSPVDSFAAPEPWDMPGYADKIIMAAGTFVQGASIEFSADGPLRAPYNVYLQGGLTFEHAIIGIMGAAQAVLDLDETD